MQSIPPACLVSSNSNKICLFHRRPSNPLRIYLFQKHPSPTPLQSISCTNQGGGGAPVSYLFHFGNRWAYTALGNACGWSYCVGEACKTGGTKVIGADVVIPFPSW